MINAGKYRNRIKIYRVTEERDESGFAVVKKEIVCSPYAAVKTTKGFTLIASGSDFEKAYTKFTIRAPAKSIDRKMLIDFKGKTYTVEYLNNVDEKGEELEIQAKEVTH